MDALLVPVTEKKGKKHSMAGDDESSRQDNAAMHQSKNRKRTTLIKKTSAIGRDCDLRVSSIFFEGCCGNKKEADFSNASEVAKLATFECT